MSKRNRARPERAPKNPENDVKCLIKAARKEDRQRRQGGCTCIYCSGDGGRSGMSLRERLLASPHFRGNKLEPQT
jgi:hypothetical protein